MSKTFCQKYAPKTIDDLLLSEDSLKFKDASFDLSKSSNLLFIGQPGVGKTSLAKILAKDYDYLYIANSSDEFNKSFFIPINSQENPLGLFKIGGQENTITLRRID